MKIVIDIPERDYDLACKYPNALIATYAHYIKDGTPYEERPTGHWESVGFVGMKYAWFRCSNCHKTTKIYKDSSNDFCCIADIRKKAVACLFCGADMRGDRE